MKKLTLLLLIFSNLWAADPNKSNAWSEIKKPVGSASQAIGSYANGCQTGAVFVPESGEGFYNIRRWRGRFYTQPVTKKLIETVGSALAPRKILVGDSSQAIGGPMPFGHSSHQNGLDVDFWFYTTDKIPAKDIKPASLVNKISGEMVYWHEDYRQALYTAATQAETARIFVNPIIKKHLCLSETDKSWLWKIRPWGGHDAHFHVRMHCPEDNFYCEPQKALDEYHGCDADLDKWIFEQSDAILNPKKPSGKKKPAAKKVLPDLCQQLLLENSNR